MAMATLQTKPAGLKVIFSFQKTTSWADIYEALGLKPSSSDAKIDTVGGAQVLFNLKKKIIFTT